jgi:uncharacterized membrane protein
MAFRSSIENRAAHAANPVAMQGRAIVKRSVLGLVLGLAVLAGPAHAAVTFQYLFDNHWPYSISGDGSVIAGNDVSDGGPFRWTQATGVVELGRASPREAGLAVVSFDGKRVASSIQSADSTFATQGLWTLGSGWQQLMPPGPPDAGVLDNDMGTVYGISGDGRAVVGLYWRPGATDGSAHASKWTAETGVVDLGSSGRSSRANGVSYNGSVVVGWDESPTYGYRRPAAWVNGHLSVLSPIDGMGEAQVVTSNGLVVGGFQSDSASNQRAVAQWKWNGSSWGPTQILGVVPGTFPGQGINVPYGITADGKIMVGYCSFAGDPFSTTGFIWSDSTGVEDIVFWLADHDISVDPSFSIQSMQAITPDGTTMIGVGQDIVAPYTRRAFAIHWDRTNVAGVTPDQAPAADVRLAAWPNPTRGPMTLRFTLPRAADGTLTIHDSAGRLVRRLASGVLAAGAQEITWDGRDDKGAPVAAGIYFSHLVAGDVHDTRKLVVMR